MPYLFFRLAIALLLLAAPVCHGQMADTTRVFVDSSFTILKQHSLYAKKVDWKKVEADVYARASAAKNKKEVFEALTIAFDALGDKHAAYFTNNMRYKLPNPELDARFSDSLRVNWARGARIVHKMIGDIGYVNVPAMAAGTQEEIDRYANWVYDAVAALAVQNPKGWIIDLRTNGGGNIRPMMAGLGMFFDDGIMSYYVDRDGVATMPGSFKDGDFRFDSVTQATIAKKIPSLKTAKVAVLIGPGTSSSGEGVAYMFRQRPGSRLFGEPSGGFANSTDGFVFGRDSYYLISVSALGDKNKKVLPETVQPHETVTANDAFNNLPADNAVKAAIAWLKK